MRLSSIFLALLFLGAGASRALADQGKNHRVRTGESLFAIAETAYGNGLEWPRIWEANPWIDPDNLRAGEIVFIPAKDPSWGDPPSREKYSLNPGSGDFEDRNDEYRAAPHRRSANPGYGTPGLRVFKNLATHVSSRTVFGLRVEKVVLFLFLAFLLHAFLQGVLVWLAANITFIKDASFKKSLKATLCAEMLTFSTLVVLGGVAAVMLYLGAEPDSGGAASAPLFPILEDYLSSRGGMAVAGFVILALYVILSLRFLPQVFGVPLGRAMTLVAFSILIPHLVGFYLIGQRAGIIHG